MDPTNYYAGIANNKPMTLGQEQAKFQEYYDDKTSEAKKSLIKDQVIKANMRFVFKMAKKYSKNDTEQFEDLIAAGNEGLLVGFHKFDYTSGNKFLTYAGWWVQQRILKEMSKFRVVDLPIWKQQLAAKIHNYLEENEDRTVSVDELCEHLPKAKRADIEELAKTRYLTYGISDVFGGEEDNLEAHGNNFESDIETENIQSILGELPEPQKTVIGMSFGIGRYAESSIKDIMELLDIDRKTFGTLKTDGLAILEARLADHYY